MGTWAPPSESSPAAWKLEEARLRAHCKNTPCSCSSSNGCLLKGTLVMRCLGKPWAKQVRSVLSCRSSGGCYFPNGHFRVAEGECIYPVWALYLTVTCV